MDEGDVFQRVAVVTGANKGIGYETVKILCNEFEGIVYLTARDDQRGRNALMKLKQEGVLRPPQFHQLDISDEASIQRFRDYIVEKHSGLDVLINNASIAYKATSTVSVYEQAENTIKVNFTGTLNVCKALFPLLRPHSRVVNVTTGIKGLCRFPSQSLREQFGDENITEAKLMELVQQFVQATEDGTHERKGWPSWSYAVSKVAENCLTSIQARDNKYDKTTDILINSCCPGFCRTDMSGPHGVKSAWEGARVPVYLALLPPGLAQPHGKFYCDKGEVPWK